jgi:hypothetical protein
MATVSRMTAAEKARQMAGMNPGFRWGFDESRGVVGYFDHATATWMAYCAVGIDGWWREYHNVRINGATIGHTFAEVEGGGA